ncbi:zinc-ribbon domain-containing protein [Desulfuromonas acetoxidans]|uniref:Zinc finger/thioredoxin putative n=1 Tax=Desulfuromonas acetoxidans (strain DSM 684 / 11070) TaxID=281689 RepID=Q1JYC6_DESA6|nr:DUF3426 domain-containing protein [Desulfuromonas acetoxidans]EAT15280.1 Zinc finger/thioredoxin putative [Desulfuromonas acetoxidans DSM 684]MBF0645335.1 zinc-ribbon domain-containing protein [Desulfuromonas acetoxidans]NVD23414.1 zinc-ribbon domain-containing protein [Desulfuromonas acetoxidans]NVE15345.1 zinc-ribbon domain-containing protein [Desulfuromonas acetoxidans]
MLIQCTKCQTVYNFDDSALQGSSIDVRCARCQTVFTVDASSAVSEDVCHVGEDELQGTSFRSSADSLPTDTSTHAQQQPSEEALFEPEPEQTFEAPPVTQTHIALHPEPEQPDSEQPGDEEEFSFTSAEQSAEQPAADETGFDFAPLDEPPAEQPPAQNEEASDFSFDQPQETAAIDGAAESEQQEHPEQPVDLFAEGQEETTLSAEEKEPQWEGSPDDFTFEDSGEDFSFDDDDSWSADKPKPPAAQIDSAENSDESPDFIFEPLTSEATPTPPQPKPAAEESPLAPDEEMEQPISTLPEAEKPEAKERPAQRPPQVEKRGTSKFLLFILFLLLVAAGAYGYFYATLGTTDVRVMIREIEQLVMPSGQQQPQGSLTITRSESYYIDNSEAGPLFVIQGTVRNDYKEPRAELSVTATLYKDKGQPFTKKTVYCGNEISRQELETMPYATLGETMSNPFGTALANVGVAPGASLSFIVVFNDLSDDLSEFSIEPASSKAASQ